MECSLGDMEYHVIQTKPHVWTGRCIKDAEFSVHQDVFPMIYTLW